MARVSCLRKFGVIHGEFAVAPLKLRGVGTLGVDAFVIHGEFAVAPLKRATPLQFPQSDLRHQRRIRRGPIEARRRLGSAHENGRHPRRIRRGPIEAIQAGSTWAELALSSTANSPWPH